MLGVLDTAETHSRLVYHTRSTMTFIKTPRGDITKDLAFMISIKRRPVISLEIKILEFLISVECSIMISLESYVLISIERSVLISLLAGIKFL